MTTMFELTFHGTVLTPHLLFSLGLLGGAIVLYAWGRIHMDLVSVGLLAFLVGGFGFFPLIDPQTGHTLLSPALLLEGFAHPALITVVALLVVGEGVTRTGALAAAVPLVRKLSFGNWRIALAITLIIVAGSSAFLNNAPVVVIFIPILISVSRDLGVSASKMLMPLSFASILGGTCTLIGTSTNILVASYSGKNGVPVFNMFDFSGLGIIVLVIGLIYLLFVAPHLLPNRDPSKEETQSRPFMAQLEILSGSPLVGWRLLDKEVRLIFSSVGVSRIVRGDRFYYPFAEHIVLRPGDLILLTGTARHLKKVEYDTKSTLIPTLSNSDRVLPDADSKHILAEVVIPPESSMVGKTLSRVRFRLRFGPMVIGIQHHGHRKLERITEIPLQAGDLLLIQGRSEQIGCLSERKDMLLFWGVHDTIAKTNKISWALLILLGIIIPAATHMADMLVLSVIGAFLMLATRCLSLREAYGAISSQVVFMVAATLALGQAMQAAGATDFVAKELIYFAPSDSPSIILALLIVTVMFFTNVISNNAAAIIFAPISIGLAHSLGVNPMPFLMGVLFGANAAFATPIGYKTNLLVLGPGEYQFRDFFRVGLPLNILVWIVVTGLIPVFWPF